MSVIWPLNIIFRAMRVSVLNHPPCGWSTPPKVNVLYLLATCDVTQRPHCYGCWSTTTNSALNWSQRKLQPPRSNALYCSFPTRCPWLLCNHTFMTSLGLTCSRCGQHGNYIRVFLCYQTDEDIITCSYCITTYLRSVVRLLIICAANANKYAIGKKDFNL